MIDAELLQPLLTALEPDEDLQHRRLLLEALTALPLSTKAWLAAAAHVTPTAHRLMGLPVQDSATCELLARVPLRSVRMGLQRVAARALPAALALAQVGDPGGLDTLLQAFVRTPTPALAAALASLPLEDLPVNHGHLAPGLAPTARGEAPHAAALRKMWSAIGAGRCGDLEPMEALWDGLVRPPGFFANLSQSALFTAPPPLFHAEPARVVAELARLRPLPEPLQRFLLGLKEHDYDDWVPRRPDVGAAHLAMLLIAGLTGLVDVRGQPVPSPTPAKTLPAGLPANAQPVALRLLQQPWTDWDAVLVPAERPLLRHVPPDLAASLIEAAVEAASRFDPRRHGKLPPGVASNRLVEWVEALPSPVPLSVARMLQQSLQTPSSDLHPEALAWTLGRAGAGAVVEALVPRIVDSSGRERTAWLVWLTRIADQLERPAPRQGPPGPPPLPRALQALIDDLPRASGPRVDFEATDEVPPVVQFNRAVHAEPPAPCTLYPVLSTDDRQAADDAAVHIHVALAPKAADGTAGAVHVPADSAEGVHTLQVQLLFGSHAAWGTLTCTAAHGSYSAAHFEIPGTTMGEHTLLPVRANFYLNQRWCGEGLLNLQRGA